MTTPLNAVERCECGLRNQRVTNWTEHGAPVVSYRPHTDACRVAEPKAAGVDLSESDSELIETLRDIEAYFRKEAAYECENMGAGGSTIALGRWKRYYMALYNLIFDLPELIAHDKDLTAARSTIAAQEKRIAAMREFLNEYDAAVGNYKHAYAADIRARVFEWMTTLSRGDV